MKMKKSSDEFNNYNTVNSQKSLFSVESHLVRFPCGQIIFEDGQQRTSRPVILFSHSALFI